MRASRKMFRFTAAAAAAAKSLQSCPTVQPHRRQPTWLPRPWDSPGKNTGVGCHFLLQCMKVKSESEVSEGIPLAMGKREMYRLWKGRKQGLIF